jgi:hypothetical protein
MPILVNFPKRLTSARKYGIIIGHPPVAEGTAGRFFYGRSYEIQSFDSSVGGIADRRKLGGLYAERGAGA